MSKVAIIGAGNAGYHQAADLTLAGHEVTLFEMSRFKENLEAVRKIGGIMLTGRARHVGFAKINDDNITTDIEKAIKGAAIISVNVVALAHEVIAELCTPYLEDGQIIILAPGSGGSLIFAKTIQKNTEKKIYIAELLSSWGTQRVVDRAASICTVYSKPLWTKSNGMHIAAFPAKDNEYVIKKLVEVYKPHCNFKPGTNVIEVGLNNPNIAHVPVTLLSTTWIEYLEKREAFDSNPIRSLVPFRLWDAFANSPAAQKSSIAIGKEIAAVLNQINCKHYGQPISSMIEHLGNPNFQGITGPPRMNHRYLSEDVPSGTVLLSSLGRMLAVPTPVTDSFIRIANTINEIDYWNIPSSRTVEKIGISEMTAKELAAFLYEGYD